MNVFIVSNWKISFFSDGKTLVTSGELGKVYVYNVDDPSNKELASYLSNEIFSSAIASVSLSYLFYMKFN